MTKCSQKGNGDRMMIQSNGQSDVVCAAHIVFFLSLIFIVWPISPFQLIISTENLVIGNSI
jgi:hypothetical protein